MVTLTGSTAAGLAEPPLPDAGAMLSLARRHGLDGDYRAAAECCFRILAGDAACAEAWNILGAALHRLGQADAACEAYRQALAHQSHCPEAWFNLGAALTGMRRLDEAAEAFRMTLRQAPSCVEARLNLAILHYVAGRDEAALGELAEARARAPHEARALILIARVEIRRRAFSSAEAASRQVLALCPDHAEALVMLGRALYEAGRVDEALGPLERAVSLAPAHAEARNDLAVALKATGRMDEAREHLREGLRLDPNMYGAWHTIADLVDFAEEPELCRRIADITGALLGDERRLTGPADPLVPVHFASGKALDDLGQHEDALEHYIAGGRLKRAGLVYNEAEHMLFCSAIKASFPRHMFAESDAAEVSGIGPAPIFIVGMPRSGSTLVEQILASHPAIQGLGEVKFLPDALEAVRQRCPELPPYPILGPALRPQHLAAIAEDYRARADTRASGALRVTDKLLTNYFYIGLIRMAFPQAKIVHMMRDPIDTCLSTFSTFFAEDMAYSYDFGELGRRYCLYADLMEHWRGVLPAGAMIDMRYEDVVADTEAAARRLLRFLELPWDNACLAFHRAPRSVQTASVAQVRKPVYASSVERWRRYGTGLAPLIEALRPVLATRES